MKRMGWRSRALALCVLGLLAVVAHAGVPELPRFRVITVADGLPSTTIPAMARDKAGFLWLATWDGVARYDGVGFKVWRHEPDNPASLPGNVVQALHIDAQDRIWVATENGGLSMMGPDRKGFRHYRQRDHREMGSDDVFTIESHGTDIWFGTFGGGLHRLDANGRIQRFNSIDGDPASLPSDNVLTLKFSHDGQLWIGTMAGLARYDGKRMHREVLPADNAHIIYSVSADEEGVWAGTSAGVFRWRPSTGWTTPAWSRMFERPNAVTMMVADGHGENWMASQGGLWHTDGDHAPSPIAQDNHGAGVGRVVQSLLLQEDGGLWVPVPTRGLAYLRSDWRRIASFTASEGLSGGLYRAIGLGNHDDLWLGSSLGTVEHLALQGGDLTSLQEHTDTLKALRFNSVLEDRDGMLWLGHRTGLVRLDRRTGQKHEWTADSPDPLPDATPVDWLVQAADGSVWLSTQFGSLQRRDPRSGRVLASFVQKEEAGLPIEEIESLKIGPDGQPWIAGPFGVRHWNPATSTFVTAIEPGVERVLSFAFDGAGVIWVHRLSGLERWTLREGQWTQTRLIAHHEGLPALESTGMIVDRQGRIWISTRRGVFRITVPRREGVALVRNFGVRDGMRSQEFNERGLLLTRHGLLVGSTADGSVVLLDTQAPDTTPHMPTLVIDQLSVVRGDKTVPLPAAGGFELRPGDQEMQISLRLLSFEDPLAHRYRSWLEGFDSNWVDQGATGERVFTTLNPGHYRLRLQAFDAAGNPSREKVLAFEVLPPWYRSTWGMIALGTAGLLLLVWLALGYQRRLRRRTAFQLAEHKREVAEQASLAKTRFLATLGHEVRTPMTGVLGMTELLLATPLNETQRGYTDAIRRAGEHLLRLVNDALDLARIEAGKLDLALQAVDLRQLVGELAQINAPMAEQRGLTFIVEHDPAAPRYVQADPVRLRQILLNLIGNAIKFTERGSVTVRVLPLKPHGIRLEVVDTGPGINADQQSRLFQRFEQADGARTAARYGGSGLGLAICQELAVAMGGQIRVESQPGLGTRFIVDLPLQPSAPPATRTPETRGTPEKTALQILLVEDDVTVAEVIASLLRARGHDVTHAPHGLAALGEIAAHPFDVALLDLDLPGLDGLALARQLRLNGFSAPLMAITARADAEAEPQALAAGFDGFLRKPITGDMLAEAVAGIRPAASPDA